MHSVDFHSLRRTFMTAPETARHEGGRLNSELTALIAGHKCGSMAADLYSDWAKLGRRRMPASLREKLTTLQNAVDDTVQLGLSEEVREALEETAARRPTMLRTAPKFSRRQKTPTHDG